MALQFILQKWYIFAVTLQLLLMITCPAHGGSKKDKELIQALKQFLRKESSHHRLSNRMLSGWHMPDENHPHTRTWMAFVSDPRIWYELAPTVKENLCLIATTIAQYEPVTMLVNPGDEQEALAMCGSTTNIEIVVKRVNDLWLRDTGPVFTIDGQGDIEGINFNFNGWGGKQTHNWDAEVADFVSRRSTPYGAFNSYLVTEGGSIEVDGEGTAIITESCVLINNRNPGWTKQEVLDELEFTLGVTKIIWLPGLAGVDITDGHTDFYARFVRPGVVVVHQYHESDKPYVPDYDIVQQHIQILEAATDAQGRQLEVHQIKGPRYIRSEYQAYADDFCSGYINYYVCNGAVIAMQFGDQESDDEAKQILEELYPEREVVQLNIDGIAAGGGGIHCATQQEPQP